MKLIQISASKMIEKTRASREKVGPKKFLTIEPEQRYRSTNRSPTDIGLSSLHLSVEEDRRSNLPVSRTGSSSIGHPLVSFSSIGGSVKTPLPGQRRAGPRLRCSRPRSRSPASGLSLGPRL